MDSNQSSRSSTTWPCVKNNRQKRAPEARRNRHRAPVASLSKCSASIFLKAAWCWWNRKIIEGNIKSYWSHGPVEIVDLPIYPLKMVMFSMVFCMFTRPGNIWEIHMGVELIFSGVHGGLRLRFSGIGPIFSIRIIILIIMLKSLNILLIKNITYIHTIILYIYIYYNIL